MHTNTLESNGNNSQHNRRWCNAHANTHSNVYVRAWLRVWKFTHTHTRIPLNLDTNAQHKCGSTFSAHIWHTHTRCEIWNGIINPFKRMPHKTHYFRISQRSSPKHPAINGVISISPSAWITILLMYIYGMGFQLSIWVSDMLTRKEEAKQCVRI